MDYEALKKSYFELLKDSIFLLPFKDIHDSGIDSGVYVFKEDGNIETVLLYKDVFKGDQYVETILFNNEEINEDCDEDYNKITKLENDIECFIFDKFPIFKSDTIATNTFYIGPFTIKIGMYKTVVMVKDTKKDLGNISKSFLSMLVEYQKDELLKKHPNVRYYIPEFKSMYDKELKKVDIGNEPFEYDFGDIRSGLLNSLYDDFLSYMEDEKTGVEGLFKIIEEEKIKGVDNEPTFSNVFPDNQFRFYPWRSQQKCLYITNKDGNLCIDSFLNSLVITLKEQDSIDLFVNKISGLIKNVELKEVNLFSDIIAFRVINELGDENLIMGFLVDDEFIALDSNYWVEKVDDGKYMFKNKSSINQVLYYHDYKLLYFNPKQIQLVKNRLFKFNDKTSVSEYIHKGVRCEYKVGSFEFNQILDPTKHIEL